MAAKGKKAYTISHEEKKVYVYVNKIQDKDMIIINNYRSLGFEIVTVNSLKEVEENKNKVYSNAAIIAFLNVHDKELLAEYNALKEAEKYFEAVQTFRKKYIFDKEKNGFRLYNKKEKDAAAEKERKREKEKDAAAAAGFATDTKGLEAYRKAKREKIAVDAPAANMTVGQYRAWLRKEEKEENKK